jgi:ATP-dependent Lon protease
MFIGTANVMHTVPPALKDRMEVLRLPGYTLIEKIAIGDRYLVPKQLKEHGLQKEEVEFTEDGLQEIVERYTKEAGVRNLEREIASICRKLARKRVAGELEGSLRMNPSKVVELLGVPRYHVPSDSKRKPEVGVATGLAWTEVGGEILSIEATLMRGRGQLTLTGQLGDVMQESAQAALSYIRSRAESLGIDPRFHRRYDIHVHIPEGSIPKDGPSAGIALATALASLLSKVPVDRGMAMTGELTLRGKVLPIGGVKEKALAAYRFGLKTVILPKENEKDLAEIPEDISKEISFHLVENMDQVLDKAFVRSLSPLGIEERDSGDSMGDEPADGSVTH